MVTNWVRRGSTERDIERRTRQIKEIVRLGTTLRAEMRLEDILKQVVESISATLGFNVAVINLIFPGRERVEIAAMVGLTEAERARLAEMPPIASRLLAVMRPEFCISQSYFISHNYKHLFEGVEGVTVYTPLPPSAQRPPDAWHPEDVLLVPLVSPGEDRLLGILSLDQPEDGKLPTLETIEIIELFASQTALAIDTARLFQERDEERRALESGLFELLFQLEQVRQG
ncbi:MAG: GAF domain-containing protein, partial [Ktedonobacterales bacterium]